MNDRLSYRWLDQQGEAFGAPGLLPRWTSSVKDAVGTAYSASSRVWFTCSHGILNEISHPAQQIQFDWYHSQIMGGDLTRRTEKFFSKIGHFQVAGVPDRAEPNLGEVNFAHLFRLVDSLRYSGWIGCEYRPKGRTEEGLGWLSKTSYA